MNENSRRYSTQIPNHLLGHRIEMLCLFILFLGFFSCLIRSDYNFAVVFFCYFIWQQRKDSLALKIILSSIVIISIIDIIFALTEIRVWMSEDTGNNTWQTLRPIHNFGFFCWIMIMISKAILIGLTIKGILELNKAVQVI